MTDRLSTERLSTGPAERPALLRLIAGFDWRAYGMVLALAAIFVLFAVLTEGKLVTPRNVAQLMRQSAILVVVGAGVSVLIIQREIDLSIGSAVYLAGLAAATAQTQWGFATVPALGMALASGLAMGAWQGLWVSYFNMPSFIVTLAGLLGFRGLGYYWSNAATLSPMNRSYGAISEAFIPPIWSAVLVAALVVLGAALAAFRWQRQRRRFGTEAAPFGRLARPIVWMLIGAAVLLYPALGFRGIPMAVAVALAVVGILSFVAMGTVFGRQMYVIGGNREAAHLSGIDIRRNLFISFVIMGVIYAVAGVLATARLNALAPSTGNVLELEAIAAAVIGGVSLGGGIGTVYGALVGALLLVTVDNGMSLLNVSSFIQQVVKALLLGGAVLFDISTRPGSRRLF